MRLKLPRRRSGKAVPGRKTDVNDATWLADLLAHGLIRSSFVPAMPEQALRDLTRARKQLTREKASHVQRIDKTLQAANIKLGSVLSNIMGQVAGLFLKRLPLASVIPSTLPACSGPRSGPPRPSGRARRLARVTAPALSRLSPGASSTPSA